MRKKRRRGFYERCIKRPQDFLLALCACVVLSPVMLCTAVLVRLKLGSPVLFTQKRPGKDCRIFEMYKFRSMTDARDAKGRLLSDAERLTPFGKKLRASSLDELPELFNVLKGDMAIVGPRPLLTQYLPLYTPYQNRRHEVRPGITGLAQINGRNALSWEKRFELDVRYVDHVTFASDWEIISRTVGAVLRREGIHSDTSETVEYFTGTKTPEQEDRA